MDADFLVSFMKQTLIITIKIASPMLLMGLFTGVIISVFQSVTQINEQTLVFIPKIAAMGLGIMLFGSWMIEEVMNFTNFLFAILPTVGLK